MNDKQPMVLKKKKKLNEENTIAPNVERGSIDIDNPAVKSDINNALKTICLGSCVTPYISLEKARKVLANFHIMIPKTPYLHGPSGSHSFPVSQFGDRAGMNDKGEFTQKTTSEFTIHFSYTSNERGSFDCHCELTSGAERPEGKTGAHPRPPNTFPASRMNGPETGKKNIEGAPGINESKRIIPAGMPYFGAIDKAVDKAARMNRKKRDEAGKVSKSSPEMENDYDNNVKMITTGQRGRNPRSWVKKGMKSFMKGPQKDEGPVATFNAKKEKYKIPKDPHEVDDPYQQDRIDDIRTRKMQKRQAELNRPTTAPIRQFKGKTLVPANMNEGVISSIKRAVDKVSGNQRKRVVAKLNQKLDDRQMKTLGRLVKNNTTAQQDNEDFPKLFSDKRYSDLNKRYSKAEYPEIYNKHDILKNKLLSGKGKKTMKEDKDAEDNATWKNSRIGRDLHKDEGEMRAKLALTHGVGSKKYKEHMDRADVNFALSDREASKVDSALPGAKRDLDKRISAAVSKAKAKKIMEAAKPKKSKDDSEVAKATNLATRMAKSMKTGKNAPAPKPKPTNVKDAVKQAVELHGAQRRTDAAQKDDVKARAEKREQWKKAQAKISADRIGDIVRRHAQYDRDMQALQNPAPARKPMGLMDTIRARLGKGN